MHDSYFNEALKTGGGGGRGGSGSGGGSRGGSGGGGGPQCCKYNIGLSDSGLIQALHLSGICYSRTIYVTKEIQLL